MWGSPNPQNKKHRLSWPILVSPFRESTTMSREGILHVSWILLGYRFPVLFRKERLGFTDMAKGQGDPYQGFYRVLIFELPISCLKIMKLQS